LQDLKNLDSLAQQLLAFAVCGNRHGASSHASLAMSIMWQYNSHVPCSLSFITCKFYFNILHTASHVLYYFIYQLSCTTVCSVTHELTPTRIGTRTYVWMKIHVVVHGSW